MTGPTTWRAAPGAPTATSRAGSPRPPPWWGRAPPYRASRRPGAGRGARRDGTRTAIETRFTRDHGAYPTLGDVIGLNTINHLAGPYRVPHFAGECVNVVTHKTFMGAYRGAGRPEAAFVLDRLLDRAARRLGLDPADLRRRNLIRKEAMPYRPGHAYRDGVPITYDPADYVAAFDRALGARGGATRTHRGRRDARVRAGRRGARERARARRRLTGSRRRPRHARRPRAAQPRAGRRGRARSARVPVLPPRDGDVGLRRPRRRGGGRRGDGRGAPPALRRRARLRAADQPDRRRGPAARRHRAGARHRAARGGRARRRRPAPHGHADGLRPAASGRRTAARRRGARLSIDDQ